LAQASATRRAAAVGEFVGFTTIKILEGEALVESRDLRLVLAMSAPKEGSSMGVSGWVRAFQPFCRSTRSVDAISLGNTATTTATRGDRPISARHSAKKAIRIMRFATQSSARKAGRRGNDGVAVIAPARSSSVAASSGRRFANLLLEVTQYPGHSPFQDFAEWISLTP